MARMVSVTDSAAWSTFVLCPDCSGHGALPAADLGAFVYEWHGCLTCHGSGYVMAHRYEGTLPTLIRVDGSLMVSGDRFEAITDSAIDWRIASGERKRHRAPRYKGRHRR